MRMLRIVISGAGAASALGATLLVPAVDGCGSSPTAPAPAPALDASMDATLDATLDDAGQGDEQAGFSLDGSGSQPTPCGYQQVCGHTVQVPEAGTFPDLASVCAAPAPVLSSGAAAVTLSGFDPDAGTSSGFLSVSSGLLGALVGDPLLVVSPSTVSIGPLARTGSGYSFAVASGTSPQIKVTVTLNVACGADSGVDASLQTVTSTTELELCLAPNDAGGASATPAWRSSGESCLLCCPIVAEMAPTPILSNNRGDDLPLARALRLRIAALAHAGRHVLLVAQNDAGAGAEYEWHVSGGTIEKVADDIVVWTLPEASEGDGAPFGQVAVWNETGAAVENFYWSAA